MVRLWYVECQDLVENALLGNLVFQETTIVQVHQEEFLCHLDKCHINPAIGGVFCYNISMKHRIDPNTYLRSGWDNPAPVKYRRGNLENKISMTLLWVYMIVFAVMFVRSLIIFLNQ